MLQATMYTLWTNESVELCVWSVISIGIHFEKEKGQHILKNPLIINSMIEKVNLHFLLY